MFLHNPDLGGELLSLQVIGDELAKLSRHVGHFWKVPTSDALTILWKGNYFCNALAIFMISMPSFKDSAQEAKKTLRSLSEHIVLCLFMVLICSKSGRYLLRLCTTPGNFCCNSLPHVVSGKFSKDASCDMRVSRTFLHSLGMSLAIETWLIWCPPPPKKKQPAKNSNVYGQFWLEQSHVVNITTTMGYHNVTNIQNNA